MQKLPVAPVGYIKANKMTNDKFLVNRAPHCAVSPGIVTLERIIGETPFIDLGFRGAGGSMGDSFPVLLLFPSRNSWFCL